MVRQVTVCTALLGFLAAACGSNQTIYVPSSSSSGGDNSSGSSGGSSGTTSSSGSSGNGTSSGTSGSSSSGGGNNSSSGSNGSSGTPSSSSGSNGSSGGPSSSSSGGSSSSSSGGGTSSGGVDACLSQHTDNFPKSVAPPGGLMPGQVPQFVMFGSDDNPYADGVDWLVDTAFGGKTNSDGSPAQITFFITAGFGTDGMYGNPPVAGIFQQGAGPGGGAAQTPTDVVNSWKHAYAAGAEIANHSFHHPGPNSNAPYNVTPASVADWQAELQPSQDFLENQVGVPACEVDGDRFPYLLFNDNGFSAYEAGGLLFDTSMEFGYNWWIPPTCVAPSCYGVSTSTGQSGMTYWWPMTLDSGPPSGANDGFQGLTGNPAVGAHAGFWEFFEHVFNAPDPTQTTWMTDPTKVGATSVAHMITGLDYNLWLAGVSIQPNPPDFCTTLKYSFLQRYMGNRAPFNVGIHSMYYSSYDTEYDMGFNNTYDKRRAGLQCFIDFLLSGNYPDVRVVGFHKVIEWMRNPTAIH